MVLALELAQSLHVGHRRPAVLTSPFEEGRLADPMLPQEIRHRHAALGVLEDCDDLGLNFDFRMTAPD